MKLRNNQGTVETSGLDNVTDFSIKVNGKAFKILLDGLYSDKVSAVIRELSTNAYDAHIALGQGDKPFDVTLPTQFDPTFSVRDYGISMTHEQLSRLMATVFDSSKDNANNQVGAFGLGSKSPFSLVDTYTITAWKDGEKRSYSAFYNTDGVPSLALLGTEPSSEPQGIEVSMVVNARDVDAFRRRAPRVLQWFPVIPNVKNAQYKIELPPSRMQGNGWVLYEDSQTVDQAYARQGCVVYPLKAESISGLSEAHRQLLRSPLVIDFAIGDLDVAASREALGYDETTCKNIIARLAAVVDEVTKHIGEAIINAPTRWQAGAERVKIMKSGLPRALTTVAETIKWQGKHHCAEFALKRQLEAELQADEVPVIAAWDRWRVARSDSVLYIDGSAYSWGQQITLYYGQEDVKFYFSLEADRPSHEGRRLAQASKITGSVNTVLFVLKDASHKDKVLAALGGAPDSGWTKDIELPPAPPSTKVGKSRAKGTTTQNQIKAYPLEYLPAGPIPNSRKSAPCIKIKPEQILELKDDAYYIVTHDGEAYYKDQKGNEHWVRYNDVTDALIQLHSEKTFDKTKPVYMISVVYEKRLHAFGKWTSLFTEIEKAAKAVEAEVKQAHQTFDLNRRVLGETLAGLLRESPVKRFIQNNPTTELASLEKVLIELGYPPSQHWQQIAATAAQAASTKAGIYLRALQTESCYSVVRSWERTDELADFKKLEAAVEKVEKLYPLLRSLMPRRGYFSSTPDYTQIFDYIEAMDLLHAKRAAAATLTPQKLASMKAKLPTMLNIAAE